MPKELTKAEEQELLAIIDEGGTFKEVTMASGRKYTIGMTAAEWLKTNDYLAEVTPDDSALSEQDLYRADI